MTVTETTQDLVRIASVNPAYDPSSPGEEGMTKWLLDWAEAHGVEALTQTVLPGRQNVIFRLPNGADSPHLLLNGHTDTVSVDAMTIDPFGGDLRGGRIWGRGSCDMKGPLAAMLHTLLALKADPAGWRGTVTFACVVDEEVGFTGIRHFLQTTAETFDFAIVGEPTRFQVVRGCKGCLRFDLRAHGVAAHSSTPEKGVSAISAMAGAVVAMDRYFAETLAAIRHPALGCSTGSVGLIRGGSGVNIVPDFCAVSVDVRLVPGQCWEETYRGIQEVVKRDHRGIRWEFDSSPLADPPFCLDDEDPFVRTVRASLGGKESEVVNFSCDASKIAAAGIPCIVLGPGDIARAHTADESIAVDELENGLADYLQISKNLLAP